MSMMTGLCCQCAAAPETLAGIVAVNSSTYTANTKLVELHCSVTVSVVAGTVLAVDAKISQTLWLRRAESVQASGLLLQRIFLQDQHWHS